MSGFTEFTYFDNSQFHEKFKKVTCAIPYTSYHIWHDGKVVNCCYYWMPSVVGNVLEQTMIEIINGETSKKIQDSVQDGTFKYCDSKICPSLVEYTHVNKIGYPLINKNDFAKQNLKKIILFLDYDLSCNLYCGSCRNERILHKLEDAPDTLKSIHKRVLEQLEELQAAGYELIIHITGTGDGFASPFFWNFLKNVKPTDNFQIRLTTNGTLMTSERLNFPFAQKLDHIEVSVDAATPDTYSKVRRGGNFSALKKNLEHLDSMISSKKLAKLEQWKLNFVVQADNFHEMVEFANWGLSFKNLDKVWYLVIYDWGHLTKEQFNEKAVWKKEHPQHHELIKVLKDPIFDDPRIVIGNLGELRMQALTHAEAQ